MEIRFYKTVGASLGFGLLSYLLSFPVWGAKKNVSLVDRYLAQQKKFSRQLCIPGTEPKFWKLYRDYKGEGHLIPEIADGELDLDAIKENVSVIKEKVIWIEKMSAMLKKKNSFQIARYHIERSQKLVNDLLDYKFQYQQKGKDEAKAKSESALAQLKMEFNGILKELPFLMPFGFPTDLQDLRSQYDKIKHKKDLESTKKANALLMFRKILEDGAQNPNNTKNDVFFRTAIHTVYSTLKNEDEFLTERLRYDVEYVLDAFIHQLKKGKRRLLKRLAEWRERTLEQHDFYKGVLADKIYYGGKYHGRNEFMATRKLSRKKLKDFILEGEADTYRYWMKRPLDERQLFVVETILFNEVGRLDGRLGLERKAITSVIFNRVEDPFYSKLGKDDSIREYLKDVPEKELNRYKWLNVLFKEGEFSFTLFFIPGSIRTFCPDMTRRGRQLRKENVEMAVELLDRRKGKLAQLNKSLRYFSRASMIGRIDMSPIWENYLRVPESAGPPLSNQGRYRQLERAGKLEYLYAFEDGAGKQFWVMRFKERSIVKAVEEATYFHYRNPHQFSYFVRK